MPKPKWSKVRGAYKAVRRTLFSKHDDSYDFQPDAQWTLVQDFRFFQHTTDVPNASSNTEVPGHTSSQLVNQRTSRESLSRAIDKSEFSDDADEYVSSGEKTSEQKLKYQSDDQHIEIEASKEVETCEETALSVSESEDECRKLPPVKIDEYAKQALLHSDEDSSTSVESYVDTPDDDSYVDFPESEDDIDSRSSSAKESSASDNSADETSDDDKDGYLKVPSLDTIIESEHEADDKNKDTVKDFVEKNDARIFAVSPAHSTEVAETNNKVKVIRNMWKNMEKESANPITSFPRPPPPYKRAPSDAPKEPDTSGHARPTIFYESMEAQMQSIKCDTRREDSFVDSKREHSIAEDSESGQECIQFRDVRKRWQEIKAPDEVGGIQEEHKTSRPKSGLVQRMAMQMQVLDEKVRMEEEMVASHQPLFTENEKHCGSQRRNSVNLPYDQKKTDDSFLKYLLEIGQQDELNRTKSGKDKKSMKFPSFGESSQQERKSNKDMAQSNPSVNKRLASNDKCDEVSENGFVDDTVTDRYFREILTSKTTSPEVKSKLKEEFFYIFNNSKTPRGVKKSILDKLIVDFSMIA